MGYGEIYKFSYVATLESVTWNTDLTVIVLVAFCSHDMERWLWPFLDYGCRNLATGDYYSQGLDALSEL